MFKNKVLVIILLLSGLISSRLDAQQIPILPSAEVTLMAGSRLIGMRTYEPNYQLNVEAFRGVKYANAERFEHSRGFQYSVGRHQVKEFGAICPQASFDLQGHGGATQLQSEDCLNLNIWRPEVQANDAKLPVYVFIHGGSFELGSSSDRAVRGDKVVAKNTAAGHPFILVSMNYRLGLLGSLYRSADLNHAEAGYPVSVESGNYGIGDQKLALTWIHNNIAKFGGDSANVTLFGESAGAMSIGIQLLDDSQNGKLYQHVIMESNPYGIQYKDEASARALAIKIKKHEAKDLKKLTVAEILRLQKWSKNTINSVDGLINSKPKTSGFLPYAPYIDDEFLPYQPSMISHLENVDVTLGFNTDESNIFIAPLELTLLTRVGYREMISLLFGKDKANKIMELAEFDSTNTPMFFGRDARVEMSRRLLNNLLFKCANRQVAKQLFNSSLYHFNYQPSFSVWPSYFNKSFYRASPKGETSSHGAELSFIFGHELNVISGPANFSQKDRRFKDMLMTSWFDKENFSRYDAAKDNVVTIDFENSFHDVSHWDKTANAVSVLGFSMIDL